MKWPKKYFFKLGNWSLAAVAMPSNVSIPVRLQSGVCANSTISKQVSEPLLTVHLLITNLLEIDGNLPKTIFNHTVHSEFNRDPYLLVGEDYFVRQNRLKSINSFASLIFIRKSYTPTTSVSTMGNGTKFFLRIICLFPLICRFIVIFWKLCRILTDQ